METDDRGWFASPELIAEHHRQEEVGAYAAS